MDVNELIERLESVIYLNHGKWCREAAQALREQQERFGGR